jgi:hypothetical protein
MVATVQETTILIITRMANCNQCGANVGCGCNLTNGLCAYCAGTLKK